MVHVQFRAFPRLNIFEFPINNYNHIKFKFRLGNKVVTTVQIDYRTIPLLSALALVKNFWFFVTLIYTSQHSGITASFLLSARRFYLNLHQYSSRWWCLSVFQP